MYHFLYLPSYALLRVTFRVIISFFRSKVTTVFWKLKLHVLSGETLLKIWLTPGLDLTIFRGTGPGGLINLNFVHCSTRYPLALGNLGDLEEISPTPGHPSAEDILKEGIRVGQSLYKDYHVYPYTYLAGYYYRQKQYLKAMDHWVKAAYVAGKYVVVTK